MLIFKGTAFFGASIILLVWVGGYAFFNFVLAGSPATGNYSWISAWWLTAYVLSKYEIKIDALIIVFAFVFVSSFGLACFRVDWFYEDITELSYLESAVISLGYALVFSSPWLFNLAFTQVIAFFRKYRLRKAQ